MDSQEVNILIERLNSAIEARCDLIDPDHVTALRLFNGFYEGYPDLVVDLYAKTLVLFSYAHPVDPTPYFLQYAQEFLLERLPWIECVVQKTRFAGDHKLRRGKVSFGKNPANLAYELGIKYALDLFINQDASFYLDTRNLRKWLLEHSAGWKVLNTFAYTGSLGAAALAGGAEHVIQVDRNPRFLELARKTVWINGFNMAKMELLAGDYFSKVAYFKKSGELFDCVIVDPPFFSTTEKGVVDLFHQSVRLINKLRPLVRNGGRLITINNALFISGVDYLVALQSLCEDGYLSIEKLIPVPDDLTGYPHTVIASPPSDPAPFNHPTKIAVLRVRRKQMGID
jgi:23S rRNA (cytosine1962-C5)-methyltransferase